MLRPNFARTQIGDLPTFEKHVQHLISAVPSNGATVDLSELFFRLTMDSATEFLFGESTESLTKNSSEGFAESFTRGQDFIANGSRWGKWAKLFPSNKTWKYDQKFVHDFVDYYVARGLAKRDELLKEKSNAEKPGRYIFIDVSYTRLEAQSLPINKCRNSSAKQQTPSPSAANSSISSSPAATPPRPSSRTSGTPSPNARTSGLNSKPKSPLSPATSPTLKASRTSNTSKHCSMNPSASTPSYQGTVAKLSKTLSYLSAVDPMAVRRSSSRRGQ